MSALDLAWQRYTFTKKMRMSMRDIRQEMKDAEGDPHLRALTHEPLSALTSGADGLDDIRTIVAQAGDHLLPGGWLLLEHGHDQGAAVRALLTAAGFEAVSTRTDLPGLDRCSGGQWAGRG